MRKHSMTCKFCSFQRRRAVWQTFIVIQKGSTKTGNLRDVSKASYVMLAICFCTKFIYSTLTQRDLISISYILSQLPGYTIFLFSGLALVSVLIHSFLVLDWVLGQVVQTTKQAQIPHSAVWDRERSTNGRRNICIYRIDV